MTRPQHEYDAATALITQGLNDCAISRALGIPRRTILDWRRGATRRNGRAGCPICHGTDPDAPAYVYLLGLYLGDGHISEYPRAQRLRVSLDDAYPNIIEEAALAIDAVLPGERRRAGRVDALGCTVVYAYWQHWCCVFPQHGPGRKHERRIQLHHWQEDLVSGNERELLRGLIHSDGCRAINRVRSASTGKMLDYPRYQFVNESGDIRDIFSAACDALGVHWTQSNRKTISVSRRPDTEFLDGFIGPKR